MLGWRERGALYVLLALVVPEPILTGLETAHNRMARRRCVMGGMLGGRAIAATNPAALCAPAKVQPPAGSVARLAIGASSPARHRHGIDAAHKLRASSRVSSAAGTVLSRSRAKFSSTQDPFPLSLQRQCEPSRADSRVSPVTPRAAPGTTDQMDVVTFACMAKTHGRCTYENPQSNGPNHHHIAGSLT